MSTGTALAVETAGLVKTFGETRAVDGVDLSVAAGTVYGVLWPNGAGKTTTIRVLATLLRPDAGTALVFGRDVVREAPAVRRLIGLTGQVASVDETLSAQSADIDMVSGATYTSQGYVGSLQSALDEAGL